MALIRPRFLSLDLMVIHRYQRAVSGNPRTGQKADLVLCSDTHSRPRDTRTFTAFQDP